MPFHLPIAIPHPETLAEAASAAHNAATSAGAQLWVKISSYQLPNQREWIDGLQTLEIWQAAVLAIAGVVYLLYGWKVFKLLVILNAAALGGLLGASAGAAIQPQWQLYGGLVGAAILAILALPLMRFAVSLMGGLAGALAGYHVWQYVAQATHHLDKLEYSWAGAIIGFLLLGAVTFVLFKVVILLFTSLQGSLMLAGGALSLLLRSQDFYDKMHGPLANDPHLLTLIVAITAAVGFVLQSLLGIKVKKPAAPPAKG